MWSEKRSGGSYINSTLLFQNLWLFLCCHIWSVFAQCENGFEPTCIWTHDPKTFLYWQYKGDSRGEEAYVELSRCVHPACGLGQIQSPWLPPRSTEGRVTFRYKIYGTSRVWLRLNLRLEEEVATQQLLSKMANYAHTYPEEWTAQEVQLPVTPTRYQLIIKANTPYHEAMVAVKGINLDGSITITRTRPSSSSSTTSTKPATPRTTSRYSSSSTSTTTTTTTTTTTVSPNDDDDERTSDDYDKFPDDDDDDDERRFQALEVENFLTEEDLTNGYTTVVEPQICMYK